MRATTKEVYGDLRARLMTSMLVPGQKLKLADLRADYGCSSNTVRDALLRLSRLGLVEFEEQRGFRVRKASRERRRDVTAFRILLEQEGAGLSMVHGGLEWEARLSAAHHKLSHIETQMAGSDRSEEGLTLWSEAEAEFHQTLISACGSELLRETFENVYYQFRQQMMGLDRDFGDNYFHAIIAEHQRIVDAALTRNRAACDQAIYDHLRRNLAL